MSTLRLLMHVLLAGAHVFLTSLTLLIQLASSGTTVTGMSVLTLVGAWAGASSTLRTKESLYGAAGVIALLVLLTLRGAWFNFYLNWWIAFGMVPLSIALWTIVAWRRFSDDDGDQTLPATH